MSRPNFDVVSRYTGANNLAVYSFNFKIGALSQLQVIVVDNTGALLHVLRGDDTTFISSVAFDPDNGGGSVTLLANLPTGYKLSLLLADDAPTQPSLFRGRFDFTLVAFEKALDWLSGQIQRLSYLTSRGVRLHDASQSSFDGQLPLDLQPDRVLMIAPDGASLVQGPTPAELAAASGNASMVADALADIQAIEVVMAQQVIDAQTAATQTGSDLAAVSTILFPGSYTFSGFSARFNQIWSSSGLSDTLAQILNLVYTPPSVSLAASGNGTVREKGATVTSSTLTATTVKKSNNIAAVRFYLGASLINTVASPHAGGGNETYSWTGSFSDNTTFSTQVDDVSGGGGPSTVSASASFTFVYPYYSDAGAAGKSAAQVGALTKTIIVSTQTVVKSFTATGGQVFYFAYPAAYGALTSILDVNNFETISDWTLTTSNITGLDGNAVSYNIYAFNNPVVAGTYQYTFKR